MRARINPEDVFCGWGDGPDVGINTSAIMGGAGYDLFIDFTADEAEAVAEALMAAVRQVRWMEADLLTQLLDEEATGGIPE